MPSKASKRKSGATAEEGKSKKAKTKGSSKGKKNADEASGEAESSTKGKKRSVKETKKRSKKAGKAKEEAPPAEEKKTAKNKGTKKLRAIPYNLSERNILRQNLHNGNDYKFTQQIGSAFAPSFQWVTLWPPNKAWRVSLDPGQWGSYKADDWTTWAFQVNIAGANLLELESDGGLVFRDRSGGELFRLRHGDGSRGATWDLAVHDDGDLVLTKDGAPVWSAVKAVGGGGHHIE